MTKAAFLLATLTCVFLCTGMSQTGSKQFSDPQSMRIDSLTTLKTWLSDILIIAEKDTATALGQLRTVLNEAHQQNNKYASAYINRTIGHVYARLKMPPKAFGHYRDSQILFRQLKDKRELAYAGFYVAKEQYNRGVYRKA